MSIDEMASAAAPSACRVTAGTFGDTWVFHLQGDLDAGTAARLRIELGEAVGKASVLLDLTGVVFLDAVGMGVLLGAIRRIQEHGGLVAISGAERRRGIDGALRRAGVDRLVFVADSPTEALEWLDHTDRRQPASAIPTT